MQLVNMVEETEEESAAGEDITLEMLAFMKAFVAKGSPGSESSPPPPPPTLALKKLLEKAMKTGEAATRFTAGDWTTAVLCTSAQKLPPDLPPPPPKTRSTLPKV